MTRIHVATLFPDRVSGYWAMSMLEAQSLALREPETHPELEIVMYQSGPRVARARNQAVVNFLESECSHLCFVDSDIVFKPDTFARLVRTMKAQRADVIAPLSTNRHGGNVHSSVYVGNLTDGWKPAPIRPKTGVKPIDAAATSFMLIRRKLIERMVTASSEADPYCLFEELRYHEIGEDFGFCTKVQAMGGTIICDSTVGVAHHKMSLDSPAW